MGNSFQDQFLKLGLVDKKQVGKAKKQKHQKKKQKVAKKQVVIDENVLLAEKAMAKKKARARELNQQRQEKLKKREVAAAIKQLIESNKQEKDDKGVAYRFNAKGKIQRIFVSSEMAAQLSAGHFAIVGQAGKYEAVPRAIGEKIRIMDEKIVVIINAPVVATETDADDPYAEYEVPDDLMW